MAHAKYARRALIIVTDGEENASHITGGNALWSIEQPGAPTLYACRINDKPNILNSQARADSYRGQRTLKIIADRTGGMVFNLDPDPTSTAAQIVAAIRSQHVLQFTAADPVRNGKAHKLEVRLPDKNIEVHGLPAYYAPKR